MSEEDTEVKILKEANTQLFIELNTRTIIIIIIIFIMGTERNKAAKNTL
jgi:hypothetical protein